MIYPHVPNYVISGFRPPPSGSVGGAGFSIGLRGKFAKEAFNIKITETQHKNLLLCGEAIVSDLFKSAHYPPYNFVEKDNEYTMLLWHCRTNGNACDVGHTERTVENLKDDDMLEFHPHNVDSVHQAYSLLSLFLKWYDVAFALVETAKKEKK